MELPQHLVERLTFVAGDEAELIAALGDSCEASEADEIRRLVSLGLPPVTSVNSLSVMSGYNPGLVWSLVNRPKQYYRTFKIPKGKGFRNIEAPKVALKIIQKWLSFHFSQVWRPRAEVHGFVPGRSHLTAASEHLGASWLLSVDIEDFFPTIPRPHIIRALKRLGYCEGQGLDVLAGICAYDERLSQGAPTSPVISNIALSDIDERLSNLANSKMLRFTRYADDITFSSPEKNVDKQVLLNEIEKVFANHPWKLATSKTHISALPERLKVHGLLVHGDKLRLTKGYRNRLRAYKHLLNADKVSSKDLRFIRGHLNYADQVEKV